MKPDEHLHRLASETKWCRRRHLPPRLPLRGALADGRTSCRPSTSSIGRIWTDLSTRPRVHVVRSGLLLSRVHTSDDQEFPLCPLQRGLSAA